MPDAHPPRLDAGQRIAIPGPAQWKEHKISDPTVAAKFNTYHFADHKEQVIELLHRVCTVSVETMKIVAAMSVIRDGK